MPLYQSQVLGTSLSTIVSSDDLQDEAIRTFERGAIVPTIRPTGLLHNSSDTTILAAAGLPAGDGMVRWNGAAWTGLMDLTRIQINASGTIAYAADQPMGSNKFTGLAAGSVAGHSVRYEQVVLVNGANTMTANLNMGSNRITNVAAPVAGTDAMRLEDRPSVPIYFNSNRDAAGTGRGVVTRTSAADTTNFINMGFVPKRLQIRLHGRAHKVSDNTNGNIFVPSGAVFEETIWYADATGGDDGNPSPTVFHTGAFEDFQVRVVAKTTAPKGVYLELVFDPGGNNEIWYRLRKQNDSAVDGTIQVLAWGE